MKKLRQRLQVLVARHWMLLVVALVALSLRVYQLGSNPGQLNRDEAALAYNAFLLKETGKDEWGRTWPLALESFGDYKLPGYPALLVLFFSLVGSSDFVTRLPSAMSGVVLVIFMYGFCRKTGLSKQHSVLAAALVACTGPMYFFSRMAFEAMVALVCFVAALYLVLQPKPPSLPRWILIGALLACSTLTYNTPLLYVPVIAVSFLLIWGISKIRVTWFPALLILMLGLGVAFLLRNLIAQKSGITIFTDDATRAEYLTFRDSNTGPMHQIMAHQKIYYSVRIAKNYLSHFGPWFLVQRGGAHPWHSLPGSGHYDWLVYVLALIGVALTMKKGAALVRRDTLAKGVFGHADGSLVYLAMWLFFAPLPAALTVDAPHSTRTLLFLFLLPLFATHGLAYVSQQFKKYGRYVTAAVTLVLVISLGSYQYRYHAIFPTQQAVNFQIGYKEAILQASTLLPATSPIAVVDPGGYNYILTAWYLRMSPSTFFSTVIRQNPDRIGFRYGQQVGRFHFIAQDSDRAADERVLVRQISKETGQWLVEPL